jgi:hypothetical protein
MVGKVVFVSLKADAAALQGFGNLGIINARA